ncbi:MAG: phosphatase PAP2 family protein [Mycobacteriales bacterium]
MSAATRLALGVGGVLGTAAAVRRDAVGPCEARAFRLVNDLPDGWYRPVWVVMQAGSLAAVPVTAGSAWATGRRPLARALLLEGGTAWLSAKALKAVVRRPRPGTLLAATRRRGPDAAGLGYVSGHAAVVVVLAGTALPQLPGPARAAVRAVAPVVCLARLYVGAHLPLDVVGGAALGLAVEGLAALGDRTPAPQSRHMPPD